MCALGVGGATAIRIAETPCLGLLGLHSMIGLQRDAVAVIAHQSVWPELFELEAERLREALGDSICQIEHVGSTSVPGLCAKPIIDLLIAVSSTSYASALIPRIEELGYEHRPGAKSESRIFFARGLHTCRTHYLSLTEIGSVAWDEQICFRDCLRNDPATASAYAALKNELAKQYASDRSAYTAAKATFIQEVLSRCGRPREASL
jgi:GrpB-like predicted nucleotidyltransferase (UPF0157 family)